MIYIKNKSDCCGCTACASVCAHQAINMDIDDQGFLYPKIDEAKCIQCGLCKSVCPVLQYDRILDKTANPEVYALHNRDEDVWQSSSSGGVFAVLSDYVLHRSGVVFGAAYDELFVVRHCCANTKETALQFRGSKYVQSDMRGVYVEVRKYLKNGRLVLFSGTPCQVEGLKKFLGKSYDNLIVVDILCHGVPSPMVFADYVNFIRCHSIYRLTKIYMKDKTFGWGYQNLRLYFGKHGSQFNTTLSRLWNKIYYSHLALRPSCFACRFTNLHRPGDLTIGDFWGIEKNHPDFFSEKGVSLLLVNTPKGSGIWEELKKQFEYIQSNTTECLQPVLQHSVVKPNNVESFWRDYHSMQFMLISKRHFDFRLSRLLLDNLKFLLRYSHRKK